MEAIKTNNAPGAIGPYSQGVVVGGLVFVSGQLPMDAATDQLEEDPGKATNISLNNIAAILAEKGLTMANVVKTTVFLRDMNDFAAMNEEYGKHFSEPYPARAAVAAKTLPKNAVLEIEAIAELV